MLFDKKGDSDKGLPDLPSLNNNGLFSPMEHSEKSNLEKELPNLPEIPKFPKDNLSDINKNLDENNGFEEIPSLVHKKQNFRTVEMKEWSPEKPEKEVSENKPSEKDHFENIIPDINPVTKQNSPSFEDNSDLKKNEIPQNERGPITQDIFVKIDKFRSIRKALKETQKRLEEIDVTLKKIRETKIREEQELSSWEKELTTAKSRINDITSNIFEKVR